MASRWFAVEAGLSVMDRYAVVGQPVAHSRSPYIHAYFAKQTEQQLEYGRLAPHSDQFEQCVKDFFNNGGKGLNITLPFKERAYLLAKQVSARAKTAHAANTLWIEDGQICADNTDGLGLTADFNYLNIPITKKSILILGAGGAVRGVLAPLLEQSPSEIFVANRTATKAIELIKDFQGENNTGNSIIHAGSIMDPRLSRSFDVIINATSATIKGEALIFPQNIFSSNSYAYDMSYKAELTPFLEQARMHKVQHYFDGLGMLIEQAAESFRIWRHCRPKTDELRILLRQQLINNS
jgi:shikimate dehydrogenase